MQAPSLSDCPSAAAMISKIFFSLSAGVRLRYGGVAEFRASGACSPDAGWNWQWTV